MQLYAKYAMIIHNNKDVIYLMVDDFISGIFLKRKVIHGVIVLDVMNM
jgi:hypothetical protein